MLARFIRALFGRKRRPAAETITNLRLWRSS